ncbi:DUF5412 family protein [Ureibacillus manganicus]|uniref:Membrane protein n=1 Tax=Ureibacillus manganicus DSM 26584 TaxID=1384049 RepID=A0A0A3HXR4_9BACL|nr:DUF5412 family protein [Ureibacillus manganicus]KGR77234.1 membrane protein [Ureibacillus manganicus DSM 26584]
MVKSYNLWSFLLILLCFFFSGYWIYSNINNTWQITPPVYVLLILSIAAFILAICGFKNTYSVWSAIRNWIAVILSLLVTLFLSFVFLLWIFFSGLGANEHIKTVQSPDGHYTIDFYRWDAGAAGTFGIRGELNGPLWFKKRIYLERRIETVEVEWINDNKISINNHVLDMDVEETYGY